MQWFAALLESCCCCCQPANGNKNGGQNSTSDIRGTAMQRGAITVINNLSRNSVEYDELTTSTTPRSSKSKQLSDELREGVDDADDDKVNVSLLGGIRESIRESKHSVVVCDSADGFGEFVSSEETLLLQYPTQISGPSISSTQNDQMLANRIAMRSVFGQSADVTETDSKHATETEDAIDKSFLDKGVITSTAKAVKKYDSRPLLTRPTVDAEAGVFMAGRYSILDSLDTFTPGVCGSPAVSQSSLMTADSFEKVDSRPDLFFLRRPNRKNASGSLIESFKPELYIPASTGRKPPLFHSFHIGLRVNRRSTIIRDFVVEGFTLKIALRRDGGRVDARGYGEPLDAAQMVDFGWKQVDSDLQFALCLPQSVADCYVADINTRAVFEGSKPSKWSDTLSIEVPPILAGFHTAFAGGESDEEEDADNGDGVHVVDECPRKRPGMGDTLFVQLADGSPVIAQLRNLWQVSDGSGVKEDEEDDDYDFGVSEYEFGVTMARLHLVDVDTLERLRVAHPFVEVNLSNAHLVNVKSLDIASMGGRRQFGHFADDASCYCQALAKCFNVVSPVVVDGRRDVATSRYMNQCARCTRKLFGTRFGHSEKGSRTLPMSTAATVTRSGGGIPESAAVMEEYSSEFHTATDECSLSLSGFCGIGALPFALTLNGNGSALQMQREISGSSEFATADSMRSVVRLPSASLSPGIASESEFASVSRFGESTMSVTPATERVLHFAASNLQLDASGDIEHESSDEGSTNGFATALTAVIAQKSDDEHFSEYLLAANGTTDVLPSVFTFESEDSLQLVAKQICEFSCEDHAVELFALRCECNESEGCGGRRLLKEYSSAWSLLTTRGAVRGNTEMSAVIVCCECRVAVARFAPVFTCADAGVSVIGSFPRDVCGECRNAKIAPFKTLHCALDGELKEVLVAECIWEIVEFTLGTAVRVRMADATSY